MSDDPAYVLFPNDAPMPRAMPDWYEAQHGAATMRLMGTGKPAADDAAARLFPADAAGADDTSLPAGPDASDAEKLFRDDAQKFDAPAKDFFQGFATSAAADGDLERAAALNSAGDALISDARAAGTDAAELASALDIVRERQGDTVAPLTPEKMESDFASGMAAIQEEYGEGFMNEIGAARAFIRDLEIIAPGTVASLERSGAGNDPRLIRKAIREARRRGYR